MDRWSRATAVGILMIASIALGASAKAAEDPPGLLDVLLENGSITREQYEELGGDGAPPRPKRPPRPKKPPQSLRRFRPRETTTID